MLLAHIGKEKNRRVAHILYYHNSYHLSSILVKFMYNICRGNTHKLATSRDIKRIGKNIQRLRQEARLNQAEVATALSITQSALSHIERGESHVDVGHLLRLPAILGCRITDLLPDSVVTDYDRARSKDERLSYIVDNWDDLSETAKDATVFVASGGVEKQK